MNKIAGALFGSGFSAQAAPPSRPQSAAPGASSSVDVPPPPPPSAPSLTTSFDDSGAAPPPPPPPPIFASTSAPFASPADTGDRGALFNAIQGGARLRKAVTNDRSAAPVSGRVIGDAAPPPHISDAPRAMSPPQEARPPPPKIENRQSVDWYAGLAADAGLNKPAAEGAGFAQALSSHAEADEDDQQVPSIQVEDTGKGNDDLADFDMSIEYRARTLYPYEAQRDEEISFLENYVVLAHPSKSGDAWWYGTLVQGGKKGFFPNAYVQILDNTTNAKALYAYEGASSDERSFQEGDILTILDKSDPDWWKVEADGRIVNVPASYLETTVPDGPLSGVSPEVNRIGLSSKARPPPRPSNTAKPAAPEIDTGDSELLLDDAYDRYEAFRERQLQPHNRHSVISNESAELSPALTTSSTFPPQAVPMTTGSNAGESRQTSGFLHSFLGRKTAAPERKGLVVSAPILRNSNSSEPQRESSPTFGTSWSSLVDRSVLEGIPDIERKRQEAIFELIVTETGYVRDLQLIVEVFYTSLITLLDQRATTVIFANIEDILLCNTTFLSALEERQKDCRLYVDRIGDILHTYMSNMAIYMPYCVNQSNGIKILQSVRASDSSIANSLQRLRDEPICRNLDLSSYLLIPMQRITRYPLLLRQIQHHTQSETERQDVESAIGTAESILDSINETIRENEGTERLAVLSQDLYIGQGRLDLTEPTRFLGKRRLIREGELTKARSGKKLHAVLCNDVLVLTDASAHALYRMPIPLAELRVAPVSGDELGFQLLLAYPRGGDKIRVRATSQRDCRNWMNTITQACERCVTVERRAARRSARQSQLQAFIPP
ncbi:hypothetical protein FRB95_011385 [Tulasnella sp. JGI-2019a]|nr:hypothetical protein FRB95_011385 [Tulasnella sp. JGI-2019a]